jgi:uncharacterized membrane protein YhhN
MTEHNPGESAGPGTVAPDVRGPALLVAYAVVGLANVVGEALDLHTLVVVTKPLLMPLLLVWLVVVVRPAGGFDIALRWLGVGLAFAWFGDLLLMGSGDLAFLGGIAGFLVMQVCYLLAFTSIPGPGLVRAWKIALAPYVLIWIAINLLVSAGVGTLRIPVMLYSAVALAMAVAALDLVIRVPRGLGWRVAWGALLFVLSDALIAVTAFGPLESTPATSALVMATYVVAQAMIVTGFAGAVLAGRASAARRARRGPATR